MGLIAYLDPGSGSMIAGAVAAGAAGAAVAAKSLAHKIKNPFKRKGAVVETVEADVETPAEPASDA